MGKKANLVVEWLNFRINLIESEKIQLEFKRFGRQDALKNIFTTLRTWECRGSGLQYWKEGEHEDFIIGRILLQKEGIIHNQKLEPQEIEDWIAAWVIINTNPKLQTISVSVNSKMGEVFPKLKAFAKTLTETLLSGVEYDYDMDILPILKGAQVFWSAIEDAKVYELSIEAAPPNFMDGQEHARAQSNRQKFGAEKTITTMKSERSPLYLSKDNSELNEIIEQVSSGSLRIIAKGSRGESRQKKPLFDSADDGTNSSNKNIFKLQMPGLSIDAAFDKDSTPHIIGIIKKSLQTFKQLPAKKSKDSDESNP